MKTKKTAQDANPDSGALPLAPNHLFDTQVWRESLIYAEHSVRIRDKGREYVCCQGACDAVGKYINVLMKVYKEKKTQVCH